MYCKHYCDSSVCILIGMLIPNKYDLLYISSFYFLLSAEDKYMLLINPFNFLNLPADI